MTSETDLQHEESGVAQSQRRNLRVASLILVVGWFIIAGSVVYGIASDPSDYHGLVIAWVLTWGFLIGGSVLLSAGSYARGLIQRGTHKALSIFFIASTVFGGLAILYGAAMFCA